MEKIYRTISIIFIFLILGGCITEFKPKRAVGKSTEVIVIANNTTWTKISSLISLVLEKIIYTPTTEQVFNIRKIAPQDFSKFKYRKNCLITGLIGEPFIDSTLTRKALESLLTGESYIFSAQDLFVKGQQFLVISAPTIYKLKEVIGTNEDLIFNYFTEGIQKMLKENLYKKGYQKEKADELKTKYGFTISIPKGWLIAEDDFGFVEFIHHFPDRIISIYWEASPTLTLHKDGAIAIRNKISAKYYAGDYVDTSRTSFYPVNFHGLTAGKLDGIWQNDTLVMGGPLRTYIFSTRGRSYMIDMHVFAPGKKKWKWLQQLEVIVDTFEDTRESGSKLHL